MSFFTRSVRVVTVVASLSLAACASYNPDYEVLNHSAPSAANPLPVNADIAELIHYAQRNHPAVLAAEAEVDQARAASVAAGAFADPQVNFSQGLNKSDYQTLGVSQEIPLFGRRHMSIEQAQAAQRAAEARLAEVKANLAATLVDAFSEYLYVQENQKLQSDLIQLLEQFVAVSEQGYAAGSLSMADLLRAQNARDEARSDYQNLANMLVSQQARLNAALGRDARASLKDEYSLIESHRRFARLPASADDLYTQLAEQNPAIQARRYEMESLLVGQDIADTAGLPRLMVGAEYMNTGMASDTVAGMVSFSLPIWRASYRAQRDSARASMQAGIQRVQATELEVQAELGMTLYQWQEAERNRQLYGDVLVSRAEQAVATTLSNYQNGNASFTDVISSQREWLSFALAHRRALANQLAAVASIHALIPTVTFVEVDHE